MSRTSVLVAAGLAYFLMSTTIVSRLGESHRRSLARGSTATQRIVVGSGARKAATRPGASAKRVVEPEAMTGGDAEDATKTNSPGEITAPEAEVTRAPLVIDGVDRLSEEEEGRFGVRLHELVMGEGRKEDPGSPTRGEILGAVAPLLKREDGSTIGLRLVILESRRVNAFSHLGDYVYVSTKLLGLAGTTEEYRFVVGHELAHRELKHAERRVAREAAAGALGKVGTFAALCDVVASGYSDEEEYEADAWIVAKMEGLGDSPRRCLMFARKMARFSEQEGFGAGHGAPKSERGEAGQDLENHYRTGPAWGERFRRIEEQLRSDGARASAKVDSGSRGRAD